MKTFLKWLAGVLVVFLLIIAAGFITISILLDTEPSVPDKGFLYLNLSGALPEYVAPDPLENALGKTRLDMKKVRDNLEKAAVDERIHGVLIEIGFLETGYAKLQELRHLIGHVRNSGKPIYAVLGPGVALTKDYYVATACDSVFMQPSANLFLTGVRSEVTFYGDFLRRFGVQAQFIQIGKYKNAPDVYTRSKMSPAHREVLTNLVDRLYTDMVRVIAQSRQLDEPQVQHLIDTQTGFTGQQALEAGLVDRLAFTSDVKRQIKKRLRGMHFISATNYARIPASSLKIRNKSRIAVINCVGVIADAGGGVVPGIGQVVGAGDVIADIERAAKSKSVKAIILRVDSPGGSATASEAIWKAIRDAAKKKPVVASVSDYGASGGYYISMAADTMIATPNSLVGSIGIFAGKFSINGLYDKLDLNSEFVQRGKNADLFSMLNPWTEDEKKVISRLIWDFYRGFVDRVAAARGMTYEQVDALARGHVWTGGEAAQNRLFDGTGYFYSAVEAAKKMANIDSSESVRLVYYPREKSLMRELLSTVKTVVGIGPLWSQRLISFLAQVQNRPLALIPYRIEF